MEEKTIIEDIFCLNNLLVDFTNTSVFGNYGITFSLYVPLKMISHGMGSISQMKQVFNESAASFGQKIQKLEKNCFVERKLDTHDKRKWIFQLTHKGKSTLQEIENSFAESATNLFSEFSKKDTQDLHALLEKLEHCLKN